MAGIDFQLSLTEYNAAGNAYQHIDNLGRVNETDLRRRRANGQYHSGLRRSANGAQSGAASSQRIVLATDTDQDITVEYQYDSAGRLAADGGLRRQWHDRHAGDHHVPLRNRSTLRGRPA